MKEAHRASSWLAGMRAQQTSATCIWLILLLQMQAGINAVESARTCGPEVQRIYCFYDRARTAIVGVEYTLRGSSHKRRICNTAAPYKDTLYIRRNVGVSKMTVSSISNWVVGLDFNLTDGRVASCRAKTFSIASRGTVGNSSSSSSSELGIVTVPRPNGVTGIGDNTAAAEAAPEALTASGSSAVQDLVVNLPGAVRSRCYPGCKPQVCARCDQSATRREYAGPDAKHVLGSISGVCMDTPGYFKDSLQELTRPCWVLAASASPSPLPPQPSTSPSPQPPEPSPSPSPIITPSPRPPASPSPSPKPPRPSPKPSPRPSPSPSPSPSPLPSSSPSPTPRPSPTLSPSPSPSPKPPPSPSPAPGVDGSIAVTLFARGQTACSGNLPDAAADSVATYLSGQLQLLQLGGFAAKRSATASSCSCSVSQGMPMYACKLTVQGPTSNQWDGPAVAAYLARSVAASGAAYCSAAPSSGFCGGTQGITGYCAASPAAADAMLACNVAAAPAPFQMAVTLAANGVLCGNTTSLSDAGAAALASYVGAFLPGFSVSLPAWSSKQLNCTRGQGNAYYRVPAVTISPNTEVDVRGAAEFAANVLNAAQLAPCRSGSSSLPTFCGDFLAAVGQQPVVCGAPQFGYLSESISQCSGAGAVFEVVFSNSGDTCSSGNPPAPSLGASLDPWWRFQLDQLADGKLTGKQFNASTVLPGSAAVPKAGGYCAYRFQVVVTGPQKLTAQDMGTMANTLMSNTLMYRPMPCNQWRNFLFCQNPQFIAAYLCAAYPYQADFPLQCTPG